MRGAPTRPAPMPVLHPVPARVVQPLEAPTLQNAPFPLTGAGSPLSSLVRPVPVSAASLAQLLPGGLSAAGAHHPLYSSMLLPSAWLAGARQAAGAFPGLAGAPQELPLFAGGFVGQACAVPPAGT